MKLNYFEFILMNNKLRAKVQENYEIAIFKDMSVKKDKKNDHILEIGCGNGNGTALIKKHFNPVKIDAIDLDKKMINKAIKKNKDQNINFHVMDATKLDFADNSFDTIFDFGVIHHIPNWKDCLKELKRVLKPSGELLLEELTIESFSKGIGKMWKILLEHPYDDMFSKPQFKKHLQDLGFEINNYGEFNALKLFRHISLSATLQ